MRNFQFRYDISFVLTRWKVFFYAFFWGGRAYMSTWYPTYHCRNTIKFFFIFSRSVSNEKKYWPRGRKWVEQWFPLSIWDMQQIFLLCFTDIWLLVPLLYFYMHNFSYYKTSSPWVLDVTEILESLYTFRILFVSLNPISLFCGSILHP